MRKKGRGLGKKECRRDGKEKGRKRRSNGEGQIEKKVIIKKGRGVRKKENRKEGRRKEGRGGSRRRGVKGK